MLEQQQQHHTPASTAWSHIGKSLQLPVDEDDTVETAVKEVPVVRTGRDTWRCPMSKMASHTSNPIRKIVDQMNLQPNPQKQMIALSIGDPTVFGNFTPPAVAVEAMEASLRAEKYNGYAPSVGYEAPRESVARYSACEGYQHLSAKDVIMTSGCSSALDMCISVLANPGDNILIPRPGFSIYRTLAESLGITVRCYDLLPDQQWQIDLQHLEQCIDDRTAAIVINNPSNPCGSVFSRQHLTAVASICERNKVPVIADEIYAHFVFSSHEFHWFASVNSSVPVLSCGGLTKRWLVPGWRVGWIVIYDNCNAFTDIRKGLLALSTRILGPNTIAQASVQPILHNTPREFYAKTIASIEHNAHLCYNLLKAVQGLVPVMPQGAMYMMVRIKDNAFPGIRDEMQFTEMLVTEQSVFCLPSRCFEVGNFFRIVLTVPSKMLAEACYRIALFCHKHSTNSA